VTPKSLSSFQVVDDAKRGKQQMRNTLKVKRKKSFPFRILNPEPFPFFTSNNDGSKYLISQLIRRCYFRYFEISTKISIFDQIFDFRPRFPYSIKISIFDQNFDLRPRFQSSVKISIFEKHFDFRPKFLSLNFYFLQNFYFLFKVLFSTEIVEFRSKNPRWCKFIY